MKTSTRISLIISFVVSIIVFVLGIIWGVREDYLRMAITLTAASMMYGGLCTAWAKYEILAEIRKVKKEETETKKKEEENPCNNK